MSDAATTGEVIAWALAAATATGVAVKATLGVLWKSEKDAQRELIDSLTRQGLSSETRAIASDQAKNVAEKRAGELELKYAYLKQQLQRAVHALANAQIQIDPGALAGTISSPPGPEEPTGVWAVEVDRRAAYFLNNEAEQRRQRPLNPERERLDKLSREYLDSVPPPTRR